MGENPNSIVDVFYGKYLGAEIAGEKVQEDLEGYVFKITGGIDKEGFGMKQGVMTHKRVRLLIRPGESCFRGYGRRKGERRKKSVRGCEVSPEIAALNLVIVKEGYIPIPGLTDTEIPNLHGPKRATKLRKLLHLSKEDDIIANVREATLGRSHDTEKKKFVKIQRLVTPLTIQRKRARIAFKKNRFEKSHSKLANYHQLLLSQKRSKKM